MALDPTIIALIRDEIGMDTDFVDNDADLPGPAGTLGSLESVYAAEDRGNGSVIITALIVWRRRLHSLQGRSFDVSTDGALYARNQRIRFIERRIKELELIVEASVRGSNMEVQPVEFGSGGFFAELETTAEF